MPENWNSKIHISTHGNVGQCLCLKISRSALSLIGRLPTHLFSVCQNKSDYLNYEHNREEKALASQIKDLTRVMNVSHQQCPRHPACSVSHSLPHHCL